MVTGNLLCNRGGGIVEALKAVKIQVRVRTIKEWGAEDATTHILEGEKSLFFASSEEALNWVEKNYKGCPCEPMTGVVEGRRHVIGFSYLRENAGGVAEINGRIIHRKDIVEFFEVRGLTLDIDGAGGEEHDK